MEELEALRLIEEQRLANKKKNNKAQKRQDKEDKRKKDEEDALNQVEEATAAAIIAAQEKETVTVNDKHDKNLNENLHNIFNGLVTELEAPEGEAPNKQEERSLKNKRSRSSKSSSRHISNKVLPPEATASSIKKKITFEDTYIHPHKRVIIELAILLKSNKAFEKFTKALMAFIENAQLVGPKFLINMLNPESKEKSIMSKGKISPNMTKLGIHVKISGNGNAFNKQKVWDKKEQSNNGRNNRKSKNKEEYRDPIFSMVVSSKVEPREIINLVTHVWARLNKSRLQVKDLQFVDSKTAVSIFKVSTATKKKLSMQS
jgi:hypothetical protein